MQRAGNTLRCWYTAAVVCASTAHGATGLHHRDSCRGWQALVQTGTKDVHCLLGSGNKPKAPNDNSMAMSIATNAIQADLLLLSCNCAILVVRCPATRGQDIGQVAKRTCDKISISTGPPAQSIVLLKCCGTGLVETRRAQDSSH